MTKTTQTAVLALRMLPDRTLMPLPYAGTHPGYKKLCEAFARNQAEGLIALAAGSLPADADISLVFWRDVASEWLRALCHVPETQPFTPDTIAPPDAAQCTEWVASRPPMQGAEYMSDAAFLEVWYRLETWTLAEATTAGGLAPFLERHAVNWLRVGRVTVHLAENKGDPEYPFAFMATYAAGVSKSGQLRRLPLGQALKEFAGAG
ncbi:MAG: hypothetical protein ACI97B_003121, partial [Verrucomicrobiales bacterium]